MTKHKPARWHPPSVRPSQGGATPAVSAAAADAKERVDASLHDCLALIIDSNSTSRSILGGTLRDLGVGTVVQCGRITDARRHLEIRAFDIVLCELEFQDSNCTGQELLEDLRRNQLLPLSTVFIMVSGERSYARIAEAAESALDSYLIKPFNANALSERVRLARQRKHSLGEIFEAIEAENFEHAARLCLQRVAIKARYWLFAARLGAELLLRLGHHDRAKTLFESIAKSQALPWARLGIARAQLDAADVAQAKRTLESLIADEPTYVDGYDVMGRVHVEQGNLPAAFELYRKAAETTPGSISRQQKLGMLAFYMGDSKAAARALGRAVALGQNSRMFDFQSLVLLAFTQFMAKDSKALTRCVSDLKTAHIRMPESKRLARFAAIAEILSLMAQRNVGAVLAAVREQAKELRAPSFDVEAACNMLTLLALLTAAEINLPDVQEWVDTLAMRFSTSKGICELLARTASAHPPFVERIRHSHFEVAQLIEGAMVFKVRGEPGNAVKSLRSHAEATLNLRIIDAARGLLQHHLSRIEGAAMLLEEIEAMRKRLGASAAAPRLGAEVGRQAGGLSMRGSKTYGNEPEPGTGAAAYGDEEAEAIEIVFSDSGADLEGPDCLDARSVDPS